MFVSPAPIERILMTADTVGGVWTYALDLCRAYSAGGINVCLATMGGPLSANQQADAAAIQGLEICSGDYKLEWMDDPWTDIEEAGEWLLSLDRRFKPDIIHLNGYAHAALNWSAPVLVVAHSCVLSWWQAVKHTAAPPEWTTYRECVKQGLRAADQVVTISQSYADELNRLYGPLENMNVIYNGREADDFYVGDKKMQAFAMGRIWDEAKNLSILGEITNKHRLPICVAGDNRHPDTGVPVNLSDVELMGVLSQERVKWQLATSYAYISPSKYEPFGLAVLEAALSGCLLLLADIPTLKELWQDSALYFNPEKPEELDDLLDFAAERGEECELLVDKSLARAKLFSLDRTVDTYLELYKSLKVAGKAINTY